MPTAARIFGALAFFTVAFVAAEAFKPQMPEGTQFGYFSVICGLIGLVVGWMVSGALAGRGYMVGMGTGVRSAVTTVFFALLLFSGQEMLLRSLKKIYHGPMEALQAMVALMVKYATLLLNPNVLVILIFGGMVAGAFVEWSSRRWR